MANPLKQFVIEPYLSFGVGPVDLAVTNSSLWMILAFSVSAVFFIAASRKKALVPDRLQASAEIFYEFIASLIRENIGRDGKVYFPFLFCLFLMILMGNSLGLIPGSFTFTSHIAVTLTLAILVFVLVTVMGFYNHGIKFFSLFLPPGVPSALIPFIFVLELISYLIRPITLSVRLALNMLAGHLMLKVFANFSIMVLSFGYAGLLFGFVPMIFNVGIYMLELLVAVLQAYIFAVLTAMYLKDTVDLAH